MHHSDSMESLGEGLVEIPLDLPLHLSKSVLLCQKWGKHTRLVMRFQWVQLNKHHGSL